MLFRNSRCLGLIPLPLLVACEADLKDYIDDANVHLIPTYICNGDPTPTYARWDKPGGVRGRVKVYTKGGRKICEQPLRAELCSFAPPALTEDDVPLKVRFYQDNEERGSDDLQYTVLRGEEDTHDFATTMVTLSGQGTQTFYVQDIEFVRCEDSPYGEANTALVCDPPDKSGDKPKCHCPNEGGVKKIGVLPVEVPVSGVVSVAWEVDPEWFSDRVETRAFTYVQGERDLRISGPGVDGDSIRAIGSSGIGNREHPGGVWFGAPMSGETISYHEDAEGEPATVTQYKLRFKVACREQ